ncbi:MAG TPA: FAD-dependent oxidoreductase [Candidatus Nanopelagicales bacterium]|nr:FAD-dependent oxidoreductase [Candidatus Nanopelagicales bacterium]
MPEAETPLVVYGAPWCPDCRRSKAFLSEQRIPFTFVDLEQHPEENATVEAYNDGKRIIPTIVFDDGSILVEPSDEELASKLGLSRDAARTSYDLVIVGGGPTGLTTAIYAARENLHTVVIERSALGGQAGVTERLDNYPGFPDGIGGAELASRFVQQAERYGVELLPAVSVADISTTDGRSVVTTSTGQQLHAAAVLVATGSTYRRTGAAGEDDLIGAGIHFCATCDGPFYRDVDEVVVIGGGNSGFEEGLFLTQFAKHVTVVVRTQPIASRLLQDKVEAHERMTVLTDTEVTAFVADPHGKLASITLRGADGDESEHPASAAFVFVGLDPNTGWLDGALGLDARGFLVTDRMMQTSVRGVFAAGDVRAGSTKQLASAVGEGAAAALQIRAHIEELRDGGS